MINLYVTATSRKGPVRDNNEDMVLVGSSFVRNDSFKTHLQLTETKRALLAVADGMGGHNRGEVASSITLHNLQFFYGDIPTGLDTDAFAGMMDDWLESINNIIDSKGRADECFKGMGTTLVGLAYYEGQFFLMNCGDSRLYRMRQGHLRQLTTDHSLNNLLGSDEHSSVITNCIGGGTKKSYIDLQRITDDVMPSDIYLLCSDGLTDMLKDRDIEALLRVGADSNSLCEAAIEAGGFDNVSVCVIDVEGEGIMHNS